MHLTVRLLIALAILLGALPEISAAQENFEIQVYGSETVRRGATMLELHSNAAVKGTSKKQDGVRPTQHAAHETLEITHGWTEWFETGFYLFTSIQPNSGWQYVGNHIRPRVRAPESWHLPVGLSLSTEIGYQKRDFSEDTWIWEIRPIIDKTFGPWYLAFNPALERSLKGEGVTQKRGFEFSPAAKISFEIAPAVAVGIEYYGALGPITNFDPAKKQQHQLFPTVDLDLGPKWEFNIGVGVGLTRSTDELILKLIVGYRFG